MATPRLFDLAGTLFNERFEPGSIDIDYLSHEMTGRQLARSLGIDLKDLPGGAVFAADERVALSTHFCTHLDAPCHYAMAVEGRPARTIDQVPLDWLFHDAVMLDFSHKASGDPISSHDLIAALRKAEYELKAQDLVMTRVGAEDLFETDPSAGEYGTGLSGESVYWLVSRGVRITGTDSQSQDIPEHIMTARLKAGDRAAYFPAHRAGGVVEYLHIEKMFGLKALPGPSGYQVAAFPVKVEGGSGAWVRPVAFQGVDVSPERVRLIDLSAPIRRFSMEPQTSVIRTHPAAQRRREWAKKLQLKLSDVDARGARDDVEVSTRAGTHMEAPFRFGPVCAGHPAKTIDQVPLEWCFGRGVLLDFSSRPAAQAIEASDLNRELTRIGHSLRAGDIVMLRTGAEDHFDTDPKFADCGSGLSQESLEWLVDQGVRVIGSDAERLDRPVGVMLEDFRRGDRASLFPVHRAAREHEHCQVLKLYNLKSLPRPTDFDVLMAPIKIQGAGSGWLRAVAFV
jgi:kynurenine formamidase